MRCFDSSCLNSISDSERSSLMQSEHIQSISQLVEIENRLDGYCLEVENRTNNDMSASGIQTSAVQSSAVLVHQTVTQVEMTASQENNCAHTNPGYGYHNRNHTENVSVSNTERTRTVSQQTESQLDPTDHIDPLSVGIDEHNRFLHNSQEPAVNQPQKPNEADEQENFRSLRERETKNPPPTKPWMQERPAVDHHYEFNDVTVMEKTCQSSDKRSDNCSLKVSLPLNEPIGNEEFMFETQELISSVEFRHLEEKSRQKELAVENELSDSETPLKLIENYETPLKQTMDETHLKLIDHDKQQKCFAMEEKGLANSNTDCHQLQVSDAPSSKLCTENNGSTESLKPVEENNDHRDRDSSGYKSMSSVSFNQETAPKVIGEVVQKEPRQETMSAKVIGEMMTERAPEETTDDTTKATHKFPTDLRAAVAPKAKPETAPKEIRLVTAQKATRDEVLLDVIPETPAVGIQDTIVEQVSSETTLKARYEPTPEVTPQAIPAEASPARAVPAARPQEAKPRSMASTVRKTEAEVFTTLGK